MIFDSKIQTKVLEQMFKEYDNLIERHQAERQEVYGEIYRRKVKELESY